MSLEPLRMSPKQRLAVRDAEGRVNIFEGAIRSGKTFSWLLLMLEKIAVAGNKGAIVIVGKNRDAIFRNVFEPLATWDAFTLWRPFIQYKQGAPTATIFGRVCHVIGANDAKSESKIRGLTVLLAFCDEVTILDESFFKQLLGRMSAAGAQLFGTTNPGSPAHWLKKEYLDRLNELPDWRRFHFVLDDNPSLNEAYKRSIKAEYSGLWYRRFILGEWVAADGAVYDMWDPVKHVIPWDRLHTIPDLRIKDICGVGVDYGTTNPTAALMLGLSVDNRLVLLDEWRYAPRDDQTRWTDQKLSTAMRAWLVRNHLPYDNSHTHGPVIVDPAAASFRVQLREDGVTTWAAENDVLYGIRTLSSLLSADKVVVTDRCKGFVDEVSGYCWDPAATAKGEDKPLKIADHSLDAGRYVTVTTERNWRRHVNLHQLAVAA